MLTTVEGTYRNGRVDLAELPTDVKSETRVIVTFIDEAGVDLRARGIGRTEAEELRASFATFGDWDAPEMDSYDTAEVSLSTKSELRPMGLCAGQFVVPNDFDAPLPEDIIASFEGK